MARRRRIFFAAVLTVVTATAGTVTVAVASVLAQSTVSTGHRNTTASGAEPTGCTLEVAGQALLLPDQLAMTLTDIAGRDQNDAAPLAHTAAAVAVSWPAEASRSDAVALSLRGYVPTALACTATLPPAVRQAMGPDGLTPRADAMWEAVKHVFGPLPAGGFAPGGVDSGHMPGSAHYEGRAIDFLYRPVTATSLRHGWVLAQWAVAHSAALQIATVIFDDWVWTPGSWTAHRWERYSPPQGPTENPTLLHEDHVHMDVQRGA